MSGAVYTPGPWVVGAEPYEDHVFGPDGFEIAGAPQAFAIHHDYYTDRMEADHWSTTDGACRRVRDGEGEANARLIAAAPSLVEALQRLTQVAAFEAGTVNPGQAFWDAIADARAALDLALNPNPLGGQ